jgi:hypothetical protein
MKTGTPIAEVDGEEIIIRIRMPKTAEPAAASDRLIRLEQKACEEAGFELRGLQAKVRAGELPTVKIGRASYVRLSDLCAMAKPLVAPKPPPPSDAYATALASSGRRRAG